ncbi:metal ABC transporter substrate-binding protein [Ohessyouella blattaphilus]|uniref:Metal ABC transporter substrate-binding protein n=1 Tax=Ohessyouella blattaphilus TaxID=2949333 RepID=A0ABT1EGE8_9FIRM|nr:metal ABC transporter substrate-binding protein [Ohessyouella blattaphilus]MCP1108837.1 metal ABC transporter substrate-binding protein [Ohessyouella blattaphilus]MCR8562231.1 metal ABC transporter substrate-binding protein [Ohessyouella blattaphilus]
MKKFIIYLLLVTLLVISAYGCGKQGEQTEKVSEEKEKLNVVVTIFPAYDWLREIAGDKVNLILLQKQGVDLHSYQPTVQDMTKISDSDLFVHVGGISDEWVKDAIATAKNENIQTLDLLEVLGDKAKLEEVVPGMQEEQHEHEEEEGEEVDEHIWLSLRNAQLVCREMVDKLAQLDPQNGQVYQDNYGIYAGKLQQLDQEFTEAVKTAEVNTVVFGDRFPFRYMLDDYGLDYYGAFPGCSAETEASFETIIFLANKVDELKLKYVIALENSNEKIAEAIVNNTQDRDAQIVVLDSLQAVTEESATYLTIMEQNLEQLEKVLAN